MTLIYLFIIGLAIGSFLNVLIDRLPNEQSIMGRSHCDFCKHKLKGLDLFPVLSFIFLGGKCRYCHKKISWQYPLIEILTGISFVLIFNPDLIGVNSQFSHLRQDFGGQAIFQLVAWLGIASCLIVIFFADVKYQIIPDSMQIAFFLFSLFINLLAPRSLGEVGEFGIWNLLKSGVVVMLPILILYWLTKSRGMGFGDVKLAFVIGFLLGLKAGLLALYCSFILGALVGLILIIFKLKKLKSKIAFGPFLILGSIIIFIWQSYIFKFIYQIYGF